MMNSIQVGARVKAVVNFGTRVGTVVKVQKDGRVVFQAEAVYQEQTGRRLYAAQRFTLNPGSLEKI